MPWFRTAEQLKYLDIEGRERIPPEYPIRRGSLCHVQAPLSSSSCVSRHVVWFSHRSHRIRQAGLTDRCGYCPSGWTYRGCCHCGQELRLLCGVAILSESVIFLGSVGLIFVRLRRNVGRDWSPGSGSRKRQRKRVLVVQLAEKGAHNLEITTK